MGEQCVTSIRPLLSRIILHELVHVPVLSNQLGIGFHGTDYHGVEEAEGYWGPKDLLPVGERLKKPQYTVMNPDSYAFMVTMFKMRKLGWKASPGSDKLIRFEKDKAEGAWLE